MTTTRTRAGTTTSGSDIWQSTTAPYANRTVATASSSLTAESAQTAGGYQQAYDPWTNTIYTYTPHYRFNPATTPGTETLTVPYDKLLHDAGTPRGAKLPAADGRTITMTLTAAQVRAMNTGQSQIGYRKITLSPGVQGFVASDPYYQAGSSGPINSQARWKAPIVKVLDDPSSTVDRSATYHGRRAIEITAPDNPAELRTAHDLRTTYWVAPGTYRPLGEVQISVAPDTGRPTRQLTITTTFPAWQMLTGAAAPAGLLSLQAQHPTARTADAGQSVWDALGNRLFPDG